MAVVELDRGELALGDVPIDCPKGLVEEAPGLIFRYALRHVDDNMRSGIDCQAAACRVPMGIKPLSTFPSTTIAHAA